MQNLKAKTNKIVRYLKRKIRVNASIKQQAPEFRVIVMRSNAYIRAQLLDAKGNVLAFAWDKGITTGTKTERAEAVGVKFAELAKAKGVSQVAFDRNGFLYHGRVKALADGMRKGGLQF